MNVIANKNNIYDRMFSDNTRLLYFVIALLIAGCYCWPTTRIATIALICFVTFGTLALYKYEYLIYLIFASIFIPYTVQAGGFYLKLSDILILFSMVQLILIKLMQGKLSLKLFPYHRIFIAYICIALLGITRVSDKLDSLGDVIQLIEIYVIAGIIFSNSINDRIIKNISIILVIGVVLQIGVLPGYFVRTRFWGWVGGNLPFLAMLSFIIAYHYYLYGNSNTKLISSMLLLILAVELLLSRTRSAWLGCVSGVFITNYFHSTRAFRNGFIILLIVILLLASIGPAFIKERVYSLVDKDYYSNVARVYLLISAWNAFKQNPILGIGINNFSKNMLDLVPREALLIPEGNYRIAREASMQAGAHNMYFSVLAELGLLGFSVLMVLVYQSLRKAYLNLKNSENVYNRAKNSCIYSSLIAFYIIASFLPGIQVRTEYAIFFILLLSQVQRKTLLVSYK